MGEALLSLMQRVGASEENILVSQSNLASLYSELGRSEDSIRIERDVYSRRVKLDGKEHIHTLGAANNYANSLRNQQRYEEARSLLRKTMPVARRVLGENHHYMLMMQWAYARALYKDPDATLDDLREAVTTLEETAPIARRVLGGAHPLTTIIEGDVRLMRLTLRARETPSSPESS